MFKKDGEKKRFLKLLIKSFRVYSIPYMVMVCLVGLFLVHPFPHFTDILAFSLIATFCWIGGMLYYDVSHADEDLVKKPNRLIPTFPQIKKKIIVLSVAFFILASLIIFKVNLIKGIIFVSVGLSIMPLYSFFKKRLVLKGKYVVRGLGGVLLVLLAPFILSKFTFELFLVSVSIFFLDVAGNIAGDIRDWKIDGYTSVVRHWGIKKTKILKFIFASGGIILLFIVLILLRNNMQFFIVLTLTYLFIELFLLRVRMEFTHRGFILLKTTLLLILIFFLVSLPLVILTIILPLILFVNYSYKTTHPEFEIL